MSQQRPISVMFSAGEASGDQHAAHLFLALKELHPTLRGIGMGGPKMAQAGISLSYDSSSIAVIGLVEVLKHYLEIRRALTLMQQLVSQEKPNLLICVDYKEFNLKLAQFAKRQGVKVLFYVSPQVWAWRPGRVLTYGRAIDMMAVIFPFETAYYEAENIPVRYVGHPSVDKVKPQYSKTEALSLFGLNPEQRIVGLLPGSRVNEIKRLLPVMLLAGEKLSSQHPDLQFILPQATSISDALLTEYLARTSLKVMVIKQQPYDVIQCCDAIMTSSGTASLEIALLEIPMVITYKISWLTYCLGRWLINTRFIGLPNIIAGKAIVKELIQHHATALNLANEIDKILHDADYSKRIRQDLQAVKQQLGQGGGSQNMAQLASEMLNANSR